MIELLSRTTRVDVGVVDVVVLAPTIAGPAPRSEKPSQRSKSPWQVLTLHRAVGARCTGAWELVHGSIETGERPVDAARREVMEETGLRVERLYSITVNPFYLHQRDAVQLAIVFAAVVSPSETVTLGVEHDAFAWRSPIAATRALTWPRGHEAVRYAVHLLRSGDAGPAEDVLRVPDGPEVPAPPQLR